MIKFHCKNCGQKIRVPEIHAGKKGKCPKCKNVVVIPKAEDASLPAGQSGSAESEISSKYSDFDLAFLDVPPKEKDLSQPAGQDSMPDKVLEDLQEPEESLDTDKSEPVGERKLPWLIDILLYPISASGIIHLAVFVFLPWLVSLLVGWLRSFLAKPLGIGASYITTFLALPFYIFFGCYVLYYFVGCILDSAKGGRRAPDISTQNIPDRGDLILQLFLILGCVAVCFCPVAIYYGFTQRIDSTFWLLSGCGIFFFPMALLAGVMFDSFDALNPISIIDSIFKAFLPYCGLLLLVCGLGGFVAVILPRLPIWGFVSSGVKIYLLFVAAHLLGWFYWRNKDKLDWGI